MNIYIVEAWRWGDKEDHSYVVGCWDNLEGAKRAAMTHAEYRGGKYHKSCDRRNSPSQYPHLFGYEKAYQPY